MPVDSPGRLVEFVRSGIARSIRSPWWWCLVGLGLAFSVFMAWLWPINYDESANRIYYADQGLRFIVTNYDFPNNHVLFTILQWLVPRHLVSSEPLVLRLPNVVVSTVVIATLAWDRDRRATAALRAVALVFAGPFALQYFGQARGFQLGTLLAALALLTAVRFSAAWWGMAIAAILMALSAYSVPTFAYGAPVVTLWLIIRRDIRRAALYSALFVGTATVLYSPLLDQLISKRTNSFSQFRSLGDYAVDLAMNSFFIPWWMVIALLTVTVAGLVVSVRTLDQRRSGKAFLFLGFSVTFVLVAETITYLDIAASPFVRNASFLPMFAFVGLWNTKLTRPLNLLIAGLIAVNAFLGIAWFSNIADGSGVVAFRGTAVGQTPRLDALNDSDIQEIQCSWTDAWTCQLYDGQLSEAGIEVTYGIEATIAAPCAIGNYPPAEGTGIQVIGPAGDIRLVCFG